MGDPVAETAMLLIYAITGGGIWAVPKAVYNMWKKGEQLSLKKLAVTFGTAIAIVLISKFGGLPLPEAGYWVEALGVSAVVSTWWSELEQKLGQKAPEIPPPPTDGR